MDFRASLCRIFYFDKRIQLRYASLTVTGNCSTNDGLYLYLLLRKTSEKFPPVSTTPTCDLKDNSA